MGAPRDTIWSVRFRLPPSQAELVANALAADAVSLCCWQAVDTDRTDCEVFCRSRSGTKATRAALVSTLAALELDLPQFETVEAPNQDWRSAWQRFFHPENVSPRLVVAPPWERPPPGGDRHVIVIDPGMSFGTGQHPTTRACLALIDELADPASQASFLDLGCGSGILAVAAAKLDYAPIVAIDQDPVAVGKAKENLALNGEVSSVECRVCGVGELDLPYRADLVAANILASVLIEAADAIVSCVAPGGRLILSGILDEQYSEVRTAFEGRGLRECNSRLVEAWRTGLFSRARQPR